MRACWTISRYSNESSSTPTLTHAVQGLMNPYMSFLVQPFVATLKDYSAGTLGDLVLWTGVLDIFSKSLISDDGGASLLPVVAAV
jgi:hypothetical protein